MESEWTQATQYLLSLLQELCWPISHLGNVGNGNQDHICDGDTRETDAKNIEVSQIHANYKKGSRQEVLHACILERPLHRGGTMNNQLENAKGSDVKMYRKQIFATVEQLNKIIQRRIFFLFEEKSAIICLNQTYSYVCGAVLGTLTNAVLHLRRQSCLCCQGKNTHPVCEGLMRVPPLPSALHEPWTRRRWYEASGRRGRGQGHEEKMDQTLQWCWGQRGAGNSPGPGPARCEGLDGRQNLNVEFNRFQSVTNGCTRGKLAWLSRPVMLILRAKATLASPTALSRAL